MTKDQHNLPAVLALRDEFTRRDTRIVAITIARGGSTRLPRKNVLPFCGVPLVEWSVRLSLCSHLITDTYVSTDDEEIADISRTAGATIIWREPQSGAGFTANVSFAHAIRQIREWQPIDMLISILPTNPVRQPWDFDECVRLYWETRKRNRQLNQMSVLAPQLETVIHRRVDAGRSQVILGDKGGNHLDGAGGCWAVCDPDWYLAMSAATPRTDAEIDAAFADYTSRQKPDAQSGYTYYYPLEHYQRFDIDLPEHWGLQEALMRQFVLADGEDVYERYKAAGLPANKESLPV